MIKRSINPEFPLDPTVLEVLRSVSQEAAAAGIEYMLVGATARDILLTHVFGIPARRATRDVDFAVAVESWAQFEELKARLASRDGFDLSERLQQRLYYRGDKKEYGYPVDLVPFGGVTHGTSEISWPPDMAVTMNVAGYEEVLLAAEHVELAPGLITKVASVAGLAVLKLIAWSDRGRDNPKDAHDLYHLMATYTETGNFDRIYDEEYPLLEAADHDPDVAGAGLLGKDAARLTNETTMTTLKKILENDEDLLTLEMAKSIKNLEDAQARVEARFRQFKMAMFAQ